MPLTTVSAGAVIAASTANANWANAVSRDTAATITVTHTWTAAQTFTGGWTAGAACTVSTGGLTVTAGGLTVSAGTTAVQALTATTVTASTAFIGSGTVATAGVFRSANNVATLTARNAANSADLTLIHADASDRASILSGALLVTAAGAGTFAAGITATTGTFSTRVTAPEMRATAATGNWQFLNSSGAGMYTVDLATGALAVTAGLSATTGTFSGAVASTSATGGVGYGTGAGGTVTQATNKGTGVTLNKVSGRITTSSSALAAGATASFIFTNSAIGADDTIVLSLGTGGSTVCYQTWVDTVQAGSCIVMLKNIHASATLSEAVTINFAVIKGATS